MENTFDAETVARYDYINDADGRRVGVKQSGAGFQPAGQAFFHYGDNTRSPPARKAAGGHGKKPDALVIRIPDRLIK